jgi:hypothetical protein
LDALPRALLSMALTGVIPAIGSAQTANPAETARIHLGPVGVTPGVTVSSGVDSNVFAEETNPKSDMVMVVNPRVQLWFRARRLIVEVRTAADAVTFMRYHSQSGLGMNNDVRIEVPLNRIRLLATNTFVTTPQRASFEIDSRARRQLMTLSAGAEIKASTKTFLRVTGTHSTTDFDDEAVNLGVNLAESLNRNMDVAAASLRYQITGATTLVLLADTTREQFVYSPEKDSTSLRVTPGVEFDSRAIISGRAYAGYRRFTITSGLAPTFTGLVASVELSSTLRDATRLGVQVSRDVAYSFDINTPYYLLGGIGGTVGHRVGQHWDFSASASRQNLHYQNGLPVVPAAPVLVKRTDHVYTYGGTMTYLLSNSLRVGVTADQSQRQSELTQRGYQGTRFIVHFGYGP